MFLLDTNVLSELRKRRSQHPGFDAWADRIELKDLFVSVISILEIEIGAPRVARRDKLQGGMLRNWIDNVVLAELDGRILPVTTGIAVRCAQLHVPDRRPERDSLIAATALVHRLTVVTRNVVDFHPMGVALVNPFAR